MRRLSVMPPVRLWRRRAQRCVTSVRDSGGSLRSIQSASSLRREQGAEFAVHLACQMQFLRFPHLGQVGRKIGQLFGAMANFTLELFVFRFQHVIDFFAQFLLLLLLGDGQHQQRERSDGQRNGADAGVLQESSDRSIRCPPTEDVGLVSCDRLQATSDGSGIVCRVSYLYFRRPS